MRWYICGWKEVQKGRNEQTFPIFYSLAKVCARVYVYLLHRRIRNLQWRFYPAIEQLNLQLDKIQNGKFTSQLDFTTTKTQFLVDDFVEMLNYFCVFSSSQMGFVHHPAAATVAANNICVSVAEPQTPHNQLDNIASFSQLSNWMSSMSFATIWKHISLNKIFFKTLCGFSDGGLWDWNAMHISTIHEPVLRLLFPFRPHFEHKQKPREK